MPQASDGSSLRPLADGFFSSFRSSHPESLCWSNALTVIIFENGRSGFLGEHSCMVILDPLISFLRADFFFSCVGRHPHSPIERVHASFTGSWQG